MQNTSTKKFNQSSVCLGSPRNVDGRSWLHSSESQIPESSLSNVITLKADSPLKHSFMEKQPSCQLQEQESSSIQSTGSDEAYKRGHACMKSDLSRGAPDFIIPTSQVDYNQTLARISYPYPDPFYSRMLPPCGPQASIHPPMLAFARVPLPVDPAEEEPIYVNPKQYRGILRRRESRAKLEAQNKLIKARKPYLHESRHIHAMKRVRGSGGRFVNTKKQEHSSEPSANNTRNRSEQTSLARGENHLDSEVLQYGNSNAGASDGSRSESTRVSHDGDNNLQMSDLRFSRHPAHMNETLLGEGYIMCSGSQYRVPGIR